jgi:hypothetical protein
VSCLDDYCFTEDFSYQDGTGVSTTPGFDTWTNGSNEAYVVGGELVINDPAMDVITSNPVLVQGIYQASFELTIADGASAYFNFGNSGDTDDWQWENEIYFNVDGSANDDFNTWSYTPGTTMNVQTYVDLTNGEAIMMLDGVFVSTWAWTGSFGGIDFYPGAATDNYSIDNLVICSADSMPSVM